MEYSEDPEHRFADMTARGDWVSLVNVVRNRELNIEPRWEALDQLEFFIDSDEAAPQILALVHEILEFEHPSDLTRRAESFLEINEVFKGKTKDVDFLISVLERIDYYDEAIPGTALEFLIKIDPGSANPKLSLKIQSAIQRWEISKCQPLSLAHYTLENRLMYYPSDTDSEE